MPDLPTGTVTFFFTDIEGSTRLSEQYPDAMQQIGARHDALAADLIVQHNGILIKSRGEGDSLFAVFARATDAVAAACALQQAFLAEPWPAEIALRVRMALHTGEAHLRDGDYYGTAVNRCARIRAIAHGRQVLLSESTANLVRNSLPQEADLRNLGRKRLKDLQRPETVYQLLHPALPADFPPVRSLDVFAHNLPIQDNRFIGREREITEIKSALETERLVTLTGSGGCGKTRLALQVVADLVDDYPDGVWLVELADHSAPELVVKTVAEALQVREEPGRKLLDTLTDHLRPKSLLLVLDNCEHLIKACAQLTNVLLRTCRDLRIVATSRQRLGTASEFPYAVPPLPVPPRLDQLPPLEEFVQYDAVRLFAERARHAEQKFAVTAGNAHDVAHICHRLEGIPLALELAAAQVPVLTVKQIAKRLEQRLPDFESPDLTDEERHLTLEALIDWSYGLLTETEQALLRRLAVFVGGWTLEAAEAVCSGYGIAETQILGLLSRLVHASLVIAEEQEDEKRFRLLEMIRHYGLTKLEKSEEAELMRSAHLTYFVSLAEEAEPKLTSAEQVVWLKRLAREQDNFRAAMNWSPHKESRLRMASALWRFWYMRGYLSEGRDRLAAAQQSEAALSPTVRAKALHAAGTLALAQGDFAAAQTLLEQSVAIRRELDDRESMAPSLMNLGVIARYRGDLAAARARFEESLTLRREVGDRHGIADVLAWLGNIAYDQSQFATAHPLYTESLAIYRELGNKANIGIMLSNLGSIANEQQDYLQARALLEESLAISRELGDRPGIAAKLSNLGNTAFRQQDYAAAQELLRESLSLAQELGDKSSITIALETLAYVACAQGEAEQAARLLGAAANLRLSTDSPLPPSARAEYDRMVAATRAALSAEAFTAAYAQGQAMTLEQAVTYALTNRLL